MSKWIQLESEFFRHPKTLRLKRVIGTGAYWIPARLWCYCSEHEKDDISDLTPDDLKDLLEYEGDAGALCEALKHTGFLSPDGKTVLGWAERYRAKLEFYRERAIKGAAARWNPPVAPGTSEDKTEIRQDKIRKHREASLKDASRMLQASDDAGNGSRFTPPTPEQVTAYASEIGYPLNGAAWCDCYAQKGWALGKSKMKDWRAAVRNWKANGWQPSGQNRPATPEATVRRIDISK